MNQPRREMKRNDDGGKPRRVMICELYSRKLTALRCGVRRGSSAGAHLTTRGGGSFNPRRADQRLNVEASELINNRHLSGRAGSRDK